MLNDEEIYNQYKNARLFVEKYLKEMPDCRLTDFIRRTISTHDLDDKSHYDKMNDLYMMSLMIHQLISENCGNNTIH